MMTEFAGMADETPEMFAESGALQQLAALMPINRVLQRLLAGLIPIRCEAREHVVIETDGVEYVTCRDSIEGLDLASRPLEIVGVTEHLAYWKDLRRVLFSDAEFTILAACARLGDEGARHDRHTEGCARRARSRESRRRRHEAIG